MICSHDEITAGAGSSEEEGTGGVTGSSEEEDGVVTSEEEVSEEAGVVFSSLGKTDDAGCSLLGTELETAGVGVLQEASNALANRIGTNFLYFHMNNISF